MKHQEEKLEIIEKRIMLNGRPYVVLSECDGWMLIIDSDGGTGFCHPQNLDPADAPAAKLMARAKARQDVKEKKEATEILMQLIHDLGGNDGPYAAEEFVFEKLEKFKYVERTTTKAQESIPKGFVTFKLTSRAKALTLN